jgi:hypothetical protein
MIKHHFSFMFSRSWSKLSNGPNRHGYNNFLNMPESKKEREREREIPRLRWLKDAESDL